MLGDPLDDATTLGPMAHIRFADARARADRRGDRGRGARRISTRRRFPADEPGTPYLAPQVLTDVDHSMRVMTEESFGPVVGIMKVSSDDEAITLMNDSPYGLTASIWTQDVDAAEALGDASRPARCS